MEETRYTQPKIMNILLGILASVAVILAIGHLSSVVKWTGAALLFIPARLGVVQQVSQAEVVSIDFSTSPSQVFFPSAGRYAFYTSNHELLVITDEVIDSESDPWLVVTSSRSERLPVGYITRGLAMYDTPLADGRPIFSFEVPAPGVYTVVHPTRPLLTAHFVRDYITGQERLYKNILLGEILAIIAVVGLLAYRRQLKKERAFLIARREKRAQVDAFWKSRQQGQEEKDGQEKGDRWNDL